MSNGKARASKRRPATATGRTQPEIGPRQASSPPPAPSRYRLTDRAGVFAAGVVGALVITVAALAVVRDDHRGEEPAPPAAESHAGHAPAAPRTLATLHGASADTQVQLDVSLSLDENDPQATQSLPAGIPAGDKVQLTFHLTDLRTGQPLAGLSPVASLASADAAQPTYGAPRDDPFEVQETFVMAGAVGDVGVIETGEHASHTPGRQLGRSSASGFAAMVKLPGPGADATTDRSNRYIFASLPQSGQVGVIDALNRRLVHTLRVGKQPFHVAAEPSGKRVWVANDGDGTVSAIDAATHDTRTVTVGAGHHDLAFSADGRMVFVSNGRSGTVSVIDAEQGRKLANVPVGAAPHGLDYSAATHRLYVANEGAGTISVLDTSTDRVVPVATIRAAPGTTQVRVDPTGQIGVASNRRANSLTLFSTTTNQVLETVPTGKGPDGIVFLEDYALVRNSLSPSVTFVNLTKLEVTGEIETGTEPMLTAPTPGVHARLFVSAGRDQVLVPDPVAGQVYQIHLMNGQPMVMDRTKVTEGADFVLSPSNRVQEIAPATYQRVVRFEQEGTHTLVIDPGEGRQAVAFTLEAVARNVQKPWVVTLLAPEAPHVAGRTVTLRVRVTERATGTPVTTITDGLVTLYRFVPGQVPWQRVLRTEHEGDGVYQAKVVFPEPGAVSVTFGSGQLGLTAQDSALGMLEVIAP